MKKHIILSIGLLVASCASDLQPVQREYTREEIVQWPVEKRCEYAAQMIARIINDPNVDEGTKKYTQNNSRAVSCNIGCPSSCT